MPPEDKRSDACGVCRRTILRGERVTEYVTPDGGSVAVCALCKTAAEEAGWLPAALAGTLASTSPRRGRGRGLRQRLTRVSEAARGLTVRPAGRSADHVEGDQRVEATGRAGSTERAGSRQRSSSSQRAAQEARGQRSRSTDRRHDPVDQHPPQQASDERPPSRERVLRRAVEAFNASGGPRKIAGLIRSLGEPQVAVRPSSGGGAVVTVAWELSWYQWEVSSAEHGGDARESGKGSELGELGEGDRRWNANASSDGTVALELAAARSAPAEAE